MLLKPFFSLSLLAIMLLSQGNLILAQELAVSAKQWPVGYFYQYRDIPIKEKEKILTKIDATLQKLNQERIGLIVKGTVIDRLNTDQQVYPTLTVLDESGLIIAVRNVPNIYYGYIGPLTDLNRNIYLVAKNPKLNKLESYIRYGFVVEADYLAFVDKYMKAIMKQEESAGERRNP